MRAVGTCDDPFTVTTHTHTHTCSPSAVTKPSMTLSGGVMSPARSLFDPYDTTSLHIFIREAFPGAILLEEHQVCQPQPQPHGQHSLYTVMVIINSECSVVTLQGAVTYQLPTNAMSWSSVFRQLESNKERLGIVDYSVSQTTLEQVSMSSDLCWLFSQLHYIRSRVH